MPIVDRSEARDLDDALGQLFTAPPGLLVQALRRVFVERLDFEPATGDILLPQAGLPPAAQRIADRDGVQVVLVRFPSTGRPTARAIADALNLLKQTLSHVFLVAVNGTGAQIQFVYPTYLAGRDVLRRMALQQGQPRRTVVEQLARVYEEAQRGDLAGALNHAYDVEAVTKRFFQKYSEVFHKVKDMVIGLPNDEERRMFCQALFNRLMFLYFLQRKGWLTFDGDPNYLETLWRSYGPQDIGTFYTARLKVLFFTALSNPRSTDFEVARQAARDLIGRVPFLNGGLFAEEEIDRRAGVDVPNEAIELILHDLFHRFNFTITESTPYDVEVAVDPEMLGKVFEELITGRHESGSYYTPRPIVSFMCREALKGYLRSRVPALSAEATASFVDQQNVAGISVTQARPVLTALEEITVVDPACGSGAYLLGMLHELVDLQKLLYNSNLIVGAKELYELKLRVIERNVYGVDIDPFAVSIAMLRLWLSLIVEYDGPGVPPALPNLDYKIACGDSLTAPDPHGTVDFFRDEARKLTLELARLKGEFLRARGDEKKPLQDEIDQRLGELRTWLQHSAVPGGAVDWQVQFAEVFQQPGSDWNEGGFDVVLANPPYVRQELIKEIKPTLKVTYGDLYSGTADLYVFFYYRALQLLKQGGMLSFISSNKWFRAGYGAKLRAHIASTCHVHSITDFGDLPVFESVTAYPMILVASKETEPGGSTLYTQVKSLDQPYPDIQSLIQEYGHLLPPSAVGNSDWTLTNTRAALHLDKMKNAGFPLGQYIQGQVYRGILTGFNMAFVINGAIRSQLLAADPKSNEVIKPLAVGKDVRKWYVARNDRWHIVTPIGVDIKRYPAVLAHLKQWQTELERRGDQGNHWWELRACVYYAAFESDKIVFPDIAKEPRFALCPAGIYIDTTTFLVPTSDLYLLGVLNSHAVKQFFQEVGAQVRGGYLRFKRQYVEQIPIPQASPADRAIIAALVQKCLDAQGKGPGILAWEAEINARVARLHGLTDAETRLLDSAGAHEAPEPDEVATA